MNRAANDLAGGVMAATQSRDDGPDAAALALSSGTDMEMVSTFIRDYGR